MKDSPEKMEVPKLLPVSVAILDRSGTTASAVREYSARLGLLQSLRYCPLTTIFRYADISQEGINE